MQQYCLFFLIKKGVMNNGHNFIILNTTHTRLMDKKSTFLGIFLWTNY